MPTKAPRDLTDKERRFIEEYCGGEFRFNGRRSAIKAGYSPASAHEIAHQLAGKLHIQEAIEARMKEMAERCAVNVESITKQLYDAYELAMCGVVERGEGKAPGAATASPAAAVTALMSIAKLHGLVVEKKELTGKDGAPLMPGKMVVELVDPADTQGTGTP